MKVLIIKTSALGDIIHVFPVIDYLVQKYPHAQIDWVVEAPYVELAGAHESIHQIIPVNTKAWRKGIWQRDTWKGFKSAIRLLRDTHYDLIIDLQGNSKSALFTALARGQQKIGFGWDSVPEWPNVLATRKRYNPPKGQNIRQDYLSLIQQHFQDTSEITLQPVRLKMTAAQTTAFQTLMATLPSTKKVMVCPGSAWSNKMLKQETLTEALKLYQKQHNCHYLFTWGSPQEKELCEALNAALDFPGTILDRLPFAVLQNVMAAVDVVFAMDSLPLHLAGTTKTPTFSVFGPSLASKYGPCEPHNHHLQGTCPYGRTFEKRCPILRTCPTGACMQSFTPEQIAAKVAETQ